MCLVSLVVFIIGATTIGNELMRRYVFGLETSYYENPKTACEYVLTQSHIPPERYPGESYAKPVSIDPDAAAEDLTPEERQERYDRCVENRTEDIEKRSKYQLANTISRGTTMILVALPLFWLHWRLVQKEQKVI